MQVAGIVVEAPCGDRLPGLAQVAEYGLIQQFVAQASVEALDEGVLGRPARRDVVPSNPGALAQPQDRRRGELGAVTPLERRSGGGHGRLRNLPIRAAGGHGRASGLYDGSVDHTEEETDHDRRLI